jgi:hypothetical protein
VEFRKLSSERGMRITPAYLQSEPTSNLDDYGKKANMKRAFNEKM